MKMVRRVGNRGRNMFAGTKDQANVSVVVLIYPDGVVVALVALGGREWCR